MMENTLSKTAPNVQSKIVTSLANHFARYNPEYLPSPSTLDDVKFENTEDDLIEGAD